MIPHSRRSPEDAPLHEYPAGPAVPTPGNQEPSAEQSAEMTVLRTIGHDYFLSHRHAQAEINTLHPAIFEYVAGFYQRTWPQAERDVLSDPVRFDRAVETPMMQRIHSATIKVPMSHRGVLMAGRDPALDFDREWEVFSHRLQRAARASDQPLNPVEHALLLTTIATGMAEKDLEYQSRPRRGGLGSKIEPHASILRDWAVIPGKNSGSQALDAMQRDLGAILQLDPSLSDATLLARVEAILLAGIPPEPDGRPTSLSPVALGDLAELRASLARMSAAHRVLQEAWRKKHPNQKYDPNEAEPRGGKVAAFLSRIVRM